MHLYNDQFSSVHDFPTTGAPRSILVIASTPRSGSHMLGHTLKQAGRFGFPLEYVHPSNLAKWKELLGTSDLADTLKQIQLRRTSPNGVFSIKLHYSHLAELGGLERVKRLLPNAQFVLLKRRDVLRQAVSYHIAAQTGVWIEGQQPVGEAHYDFRAIDKCLRRLLQDNAGWSYTLATDGCPFLEVDFDSAKKDLRATILQIARFAEIEIAPEQAPTTAPTKKQSNLLTDEWCARFVAEHRQLPAAQRALAAASFTMRSAIDQVSLLLRQSKHDLASLRLRGNGPLQLTKSKP